MAIPFLVFWVLLVLACEELGIKGIAVAVAVWTMLLVGFAVVGISPYLFVVPQVVLDVVLILVAFGGDIKLR
jgi:hypothetical protein